jgi:fibronectin-binding autotransporter adhesin
MKIMKSRWVAGLPYGMVVTTDDHAEIEKDKNMKTRKTMLIRSVLPITCAGIVFSAQAVSYVWDTAPGVVGAGDGAVTGGTGDWNTEAGNWTTDGGANNVAWPGSGTDNEAVFGGTPGTVTLPAAGVAANRLIFNTSYTVTNATLTLNGTTPTITVGQDVSASIYAAVASPARANTDTGLIKAGPGLLALCNTNRGFKGTAIINAGTLTLNGPDVKGGALGQPGGGLNGMPIIVNNGGTLVVSNNWLVVLWEPITVNSGGTLTFPKFAPSGEIDCHYMNMLTLTDALVNGDGQFRLGNGVGKVTVNAGSVGSVISAGINLVKNNNDQHVAIFDVADGNALHDLTITSTIRDCYTTMLTCLPVVKTGLGTLLLAGASNYTGPTIVSNGTLLVNGSLMSTNTGLVHASAGLGGTGRLSDGTFTLANGATLTPGDPVENDGIGTLTFCNLTLANVWYQCDYGAASSDHVNVTNALTLPDRLTVCLSPVGGAPLPSEIVLFSANTLTRTPDFSKWELIGCEGTVAIQDNTRVVLTITGGDAKKLYYWDVNGAATGAGGTTPSGNWDGVSLVWNTDFYGGAGIFTNLTSATDLLCFSAGSEATGTYLVDLSGGTRSAGTMMFKNGVATLTNGTLACGVFDVRTGTADFRATVSGTGTPLVKKGAGTLLLAGDNTSFAEGWVISQGQVALNHTNALGSGTITLGDANSDDTPIMLCANVPGQKILNPIVVTAESTGSVAINGTGKTLEYHGSLTLNRPTTLGGDTGDRYAYLGKISGDVGVLTFDSDRITLNQGSTKANDFVGRVVITPGKLLQLNNFYGLSSSHAVEVNGTLTFAFGSFSPTRHFTIGTLTGTGRVQPVSDGSTNHHSTVQIGGDNGSGTFNGTLNNCSYNKSILSLRKAGTGVQTLSGINTYTGPTTISAGTLKLGVANALTNSEITVESGATLDLGGETQHVKALAGTGGTLRVNIAEDGLSCDQVIVPGDLNLGGLNLEIAGAEHLKPSKTYLFASSSGGIRNGVFAQAAVPAKWFILYTPVGAQLEFQRGTLISLR